MQESRLSKLRLTATFVPQKVTPAVRLVSTRSEIVEPVVCKERERPLDFGVEGVRIGHLHFQQNRLNSQSVRPRYPDRSLGEVGPLIVDLTRILGGRVRISGGLAVRMGGWTGGTDITRERGVTQDWKSPPRQLRGGWRGDRGRLYHRAIQMVSSLHGMGPWRARNDPM